MSNTLFAAQIAAADAISPLSGTDLVKAKVKQLVVMGGAFPVGPGECNFIGAPQDTQYVVANWPTPILFTGFEIGSPILSGRSLASTPQSNPVRRAYGGWTKNGRSSWDLTAVLAAVRDPHLYWDISPNGTCQVEPNGVNHWVPDPKGNRTYLIQKLPPKEVADLLDQLLAMPPRAKTSISK